MNRQIFMSAGKNINPDNVTVEARARRLRDRFVDSGFASIEPPILQPSEAFIGLSGEDIRRRLYLVQGEGGEELCLRPDLTIPVARIHLESGADQARYCYAGPSFRRVSEAETSNLPGEFQQAGFELFGSSEPETDMQIFALAVGALKAEGLDAVQVRMGHPGIFRALIAALDIPDFWRGRLLRHFWRRDLATGIAAAFANSPSKASGSEAFAAALTSLDRDAASGLVEEVLALAGIKPVGGRSADEIAHRFMERAALAAEPLPGKIISIVQEYLSLEGSPDQVVSGIVALNKEHKFALDVEIEALSTQLNEAEKILQDICGSDTSLLFAADFGRNLEYYTGLVFELHDSNNPHLRQIAGGGRYDRLLTGLGSKKDVPAVGCAIYVDRLSQALEGGNS